MAHVEELQELALAVLPGGAVPGGDLPPARDAGLAGEELVAGVAELIGLGLGHGPGAYDGEVAQEHVQELGHLVEGGPPEHAPHAGDPGVVVELLLAPPGLELLGGHVALRVLVGVGHHGAELEDADPPPVQAHSLLTEDRAARGVRADHGAEDGPGDEPHEAGDPGEGDVEGALDEAVARPAAPGRGDAGVGRRRDEGRRGRRDFLASRAF